MPEQPHQGHSLEVWDEVLPQLLVWRSGMEVQLPHLLITGLEALLQQAPLLMSQVTHSTPCYCWPSLAV